MPVIRNRLAATRAGGPRQFSEVRNKFLIEVTDDGAVGDVLSELDSINITGDTLDTAPMVIAEPTGTIEDVIDSVIDIGGEVNDAEQALRDIDNARDAKDTIIDATSSVVSTTNAVLNVISSIDGISLADFVTTSADFGPENLRIGPDELNDVPSDEAPEGEGNLEKLNREMGMLDAWDDTRGEGVTVAIFDTGFAKDLISDRRIVGTFHGDGVDSVWAPAEGHGTMTAGAAVASKKDGVPYNGTAPGADVILVRTTDSEGQINSGVIAKAWDWLNQRNNSNPVVTNHSYGTPLCSGRPRVSFCETPLNNLINMVNEDSDIISVYAAGNEAMQCGHRLSGVTNGITGTNSLSSVITVGALRLDGVDAQRYSSHGRGDCAPIADPKPNVSARLPMMTYYGAEGGYKIKDMSIGAGGSAGGTSHASPTVAGLIALIQSKSVRDNGGPLDTEDVRFIIQRAAKPPRTTQINRFGFVLGQKGYDARFGHGEIDINEALSEVVR